jgi:peptidoglycan hydrolase FlgJ
MEAHFLKEMLKNMRKTVQESPEMQANKGYQVFRGMLDEQYAETAARTQGIGLAELIVRQVLEMQEAATPRVSPEIRSVNGSDIIKK